MDPDFHKLSLRLYDVLETIGASEDTRKKFRETAIAMEISDSVIQLPNKSTYFFGSSCEGTTTLGLQSDYDRMNVIETQPVVESVNDGPWLQSFLLIVTDDTMPGYVKLQHGFHRVLLPPHTISRLVAFGMNDADGMASDSKGRICQQHVSGIGKVRSAKLKRHGPADTTEESNQGAESDQVFAYRCRIVPKAVSDWINKKRPHGWPSQTKLQKMRAYGCFFVGVGHPKSCHPSIEWRISFSLQERELMFSLNPTQHKCYILLKMIKKDLIHPKTGKSISSYHCKTCLWHTIEGTESQFWIPENLIQATRRCIKLLLTWLEDGHCPNYFVPQENMFDKVQSGPLRLVQPVLEDILASGVRFLYELKTDDVGKILQDSNLCGARLTESRKEYRSIMYGQIVCNYLADIYGSRNYLLKKHCSTKTLDECQETALSLLCRLQHTTVITEHSLADIQRTLHPIMAHIHLQIAQCAATHELTSTNTIKTNEVSQVFKHHIEASVTCDLYSQQLILATYNLQRGMIGECERILKNVRTGPKPPSLSMCRCTDYRIFEAILWEDLMTEDLQHGLFLLTTGCMLFLPPQARFVHPALQYEMYRSLYTPSGSRIDSIQFWFDWIAVDSKVYRFFLEYILFSKTNKPTEKQEAVKELQHAINTDPNLGHRETAYNLLGWIFTKENRLQKALQCFCKSWQIRPDHNAAKLHLAMCCYQQFLTL